MKWFSKLKKANFWIKFLILLFVIYVINVLLNTQNVVHEGFAQRQKYVEKHNKELYDDFYSRIYDKLFMNENKVEMNEIIRNVKPTKKSYFLDVGTGTGTAANILQSKGFKVIGLDSSKDMISIAKNKYPDLKLKQGSVLQSILFSPNTFTHILCLYFTLYYMKNKQLFFENCYNWLKPGGYLVVHLVNRDNFNPIIPASDPLFIVSPQKHAPQRMTKSSVKFNNFQYKSHFKLQKNKSNALFEETFKDDATGNVRKNVHTLYMDTQRNILSLAKDAGFKLKGKIDMTTMQYDNQYLYIMYKPQ